MTGEQNVLIIAGMHRSGTSLVTNLLMKSGLFVGDKLMEYGNHNNKSHGFDNKKGHFEDFEFLDIHQGDLYRKGFDKRGLSYIPEDALEFDDTSTSKINKLLTNRKRLDLWGWKEPRTTLYLKNWKKVIPSAKVIAVYRDYDEVVSSILKRYILKIKHGVGISKIRRILHLLVFPVNYFLILRQSYRAWYIYNKHILEFKSKYPEDIIIVNLNHLLSNYSNILNQVNTQFNIDLSHIEVSGIYDKSLLSGRKTKSKFRNFSYKKLTYLEKQLQKHSLWT